jgi:hypothetical protein
MFRWAKSRIGYIYIYINENTAILKMYQTGFGNVIPGNLPRQGKTYLSVTGWETKYLKSKQKQGKVGSTGAFKFIALFVSLYLCTNLKG